MHYDYDYDNDKKQDTKSVLKFKCLVLTVSAALSQWILKKEFFKERIQKERGEFSQMNDAFRIKISWDLKLLISNSPQLHIWVHLIFEF
jgi:hypothetical protein